MSGLSPAGIHLRPRKRLPQERLGLGELALLVEEHGKSLQRTRVARVRAERAGHSDWTALAKEVQRELYARLFADQPIESYLREVVARLRAGQLDDRLVYHRALRKRPETYIATTPPHVAVARKTG